MALCKFVVAPAIAQGSFDFGMDKSEKHRLHLNLTSRYVIPGSDSSILFTSTADFFTCAAAGGWPSADIERPAGRGLASFSQNIQNGRDAESDQIERCHHISHFLPNETVWLVQEFSETT